MESTVVKIAVLVSGTGSILEAFLREGVPIAVVLADRECRALEIAKNAGIPAELVERGDFGKNFDRDGYTQKVSHILKEHGIEVIAMAGFMTFFAPAIFKEYSGRILNTHPSLLPDFKGDRAVADALAAHANETGFTLHIATEKLDDGKILAQERVPIEAGDTVESLHERIKEAERKTYPQILKEIARGNLVLD